MTVLRAVLNGSPAPRPQVITHFQRQLPVYSPLPLGAVWRAARRVFRSAEDSRPRARELIRASYAAERVVLTGTGTHALQIALRAASRLVGGDLTVALPAFTCFDVAAAAVGAGARIALYDLDPATLAPDLDSLALTLAGGARIVVAAPLYGIPIDWEALEACTAPFGAVIIEDAAQGHGARWRGRPLGSLGPLSVLSFGRGKGWTGGAGGALLLHRQSDRGARDDAMSPPFLEPGIRSEWRVLLGATAQSALARPSLYSLPASVPWLHLGETRYHAPARPAGMTRTAAALLDITHDVAMRESVMRRANAEFLLERIPCGERVGVPSGSVPGYLRLPVRTPRGLAGFRDPAAAFRWGIMRSYPSTLAMLRPVQQRLTQFSRWPGAEDLVRQLITLPTHSLLKARDRETLVRILETKRS